MTAGTAKSRLGAGLQPIQRRRNAVRRYVANRAASGSLLFLAVLVLLCAAAPVISPFDQSEIFWDSIAAPPSSSHWFGTDLYGRDLFIRVLNGGRVSLAVGVLATFVSLLIGVTYGAVAGFLGGRADELMMRVIDVLYALPFMFFVILLTVVFGRSIFLLFLAIGAIGWLTMARVVRGQAMTLSRQPFVEAALVSGLTKRQIILRHIIPNLAGSVAIFGTLTVPQMILTESFLSFLGLGVQEPLASWGTLVSEGASAFETAPWLLIFPGLFLSMTLFAMNAVGDGLRDSFDIRASSA